MKASAQHLAKLKTHDAQQKTCERLQYGPLNLATGRCETRLDDDLAPNYRRVVATTLMERMRMTMPMLMVIAMTMREGA